MSTFVQSLTTLDLFFIGVLVLSLAVGAWRGLIHEALSLASWMGALFAAYAWSDDLLPHLPAQGLSEAPRYGLAFILIFVFTLIGCALLTALLKKMMGAAGLRSFDRLLGAIFGCARGLVILISLTQLIGYTPIHASQEWQSSLAVRLTKSLAQSMKPLLPSTVKQLIPSPSPSNL